MSYDVVVTSTARRDLQRIPPRIVPAIIEFVFGDLALNTTRVGKPLERELAGTFSARRGPYRVLYRIDHDAEVSPTSLFRSTVVMVSSFGSPADPAGY